MDILNTSSLTSYASSIAANNATQAMSDKAKAAQTDEELMDACKEFENYLWEQVLKSMKSTVNFAGEEGSNSQMVEYFMDSAISDVATQLTDKTMGPNSLAQQMYEQMKRYNTIDVETLLSQSKETSEESDKDVSNETSEKISIVSDSE